MSLNNSNFILHFLLFVSARATEKIRDAAGQHAQVVVLPECFNSPFGIKFFPEFAEEIPAGPTRFLNFKFFVETATTVREATIANKTIL